MNLDEFERELNERLGEAGRGAGAQPGARGDLGDYLAVRAANDQLRERGVRSLVDAFTALAGEANRAGAGVQLTREEAHRFHVGNSVMVGTRVVFSRGVRSLTIEAGWPRSPRDGIVRGQGLAAARVTHFGDRAAGEELLLALDEGGEPLWLSLEDGRARAEFQDGPLRRHFAKLLGLK